MFQDCKLPFAVLMYPEHAVKGDSCAGKAEFFTSSKDAALMYRRQVAQPTFARNTGNTDTGSVLHDGSVLLESRGKKCIFGIIWT